MSSQPQNEALVYNDAEKGTLEVVSLPNLSKQYPDEKTVALVDTPPAKFLDVKQALPPPATKKPAAKPKRKVSKWILFTLWFNTYRSVSMPHPSLS